MSARVSNANQRATAGDRKVVFKSVLDNPFKVSWPYVPLNVQNVALASLVTVLAGVAEYHSERHAASRKRKRARHDKQRKEKAIARKRRKADDEDAQVAPDDGNDAAIATQSLPDDEAARMDIELEPDAELPPPPAVLDHLTFGINEVTKRLESQARSLRLRTSIYASTSSPSVQDPSPTSEPESALAYVFVCRADIDPPLLFAHFPELVAACNSPLPSRISSPVYLIPLPKQAENTLAETVGLRRVSVLALDSTTPSLATLSSILAAVQPPSAPWLTGPGPGPAHVPTHIKQLRTTAPRDMRAAKQARTKGRQAAKDRRKTKTKTTAANEDVPAKANPKVKSTAKVKKRIKIISSTTAAVQGLLPM